MICRDGFLARASTVRKAQEASPGRLEEED